MTHARTQKQLALVFRRQKTLTQRAVSPLSMEPQSLRRELNAAFARPNDVQLLGKLHGMLRQSKGLLRDPLRIAGRNADQRKALEEAKTKPADPVHLPGRAPERIPEPQRKMLIDAVCFLAFESIVSLLRCSESTMKMQLALKKKLQLEIFLSDHPS